MMTANSPIDKDTMQQAANHISSHETFVATRTPAPSPPRVYHAHEVRAAVEKRIRMWQYPDDEECTVTIYLRRGNKFVEHEVKRKKNGSFYITNNERKFVPLNTFLRIAA